MEKAKIERGAKITGWMDKLLAMAYEANEEVKAFALNGDDQVALVHWAESIDSIIRVKATTKGDEVAALALTGYKHPVAGEIINIDGSASLKPGEIALKLKMKE